MNQKISEFFLTHEKNMKIVLEYNVLGFTRETASAGNNKHVKKNLKKVSSSRALKKT